MIISRGFGEYSITTKLGRMVYYLAQPEPCHPSINYILARVWQTNWAFGAF